MRFDLPDDATEEEVEAYLATLEERARHQVRELLRAGASADEVNEYLEDLRGGLADDEEADEEEVERRAQA